MGILIKNGHVIDPGNNIDGVMDIYIEDSKISDISNNLSTKSSDDEVIDASGMIVAPGLFDMHVHLREPGFEYKEDIASGTNSAAMGGFTSVACMPNTKPVIDSTALVQFITDTAKNAGKVNVYPIGALSKGQNGEELSEIGELKYAGAVAISDDGKPVNNAALMRRALQYASMFGIAVISHCEDMSLVEGGVMNEGYVATTLGLRGITPAAEEVMVARDILLAENEGVPVHIAHVSTKGSVRLVREAKERGVRVTCETCPHYFVLIDAALEGFDTNAKMNPPLRSEEDRLAIIEGLRDGTIDVIATDHAPHHIDEKNCEFSNAANGIVGLETSLPLSVSYLVKTGVLTISELMCKMSLNPANILNLCKGNLSKGRAADVVIFNPDEKYKIDVTKFASKSKNSPFDDFEVYGKVQYTIVGGSLVVNRGELL